MTPIHSTFAPCLTLAMTWNPVVTNILVGVFLLISGAMILLVLIQRPQGGGLSGAFGAGGGGGAGQTAFGTKTGDVLTSATISIFFLFLLAAIVLNFAARPNENPNPVPAVTTPQDDNNATDTDQADTEQAQPADADDGTPDESSVGVDEPAPTDETRDAPSDEQGEGED